MNRNNYVRRVYLCCGLAWLASLALAFYTTPGGIEAKCYEVLSVACLSACYLFAFRAIAFILDGM